MGPQEGVPILPCAFGRDLFCYGMRDQQTNWTMVLDSSCRGFLVWYLGLKEYSTKKICKKSLLKRS